ncbi:transposase-like zinc-binding domain-containing protein [Flavobacterium columnare]
MKNSKKKKRCPTCKSLETIKWGIQQNKQRFKCKYCGQLFTSSNNICFRF